MTPDEISTYLQQLTGNRTGGIWDAAYYMARVNEGYRRLATFHHVTQKGEVRTLRFQQFYDRLKDRVLAALPTDNFVANQSGVFALLGLYDRTNDQPIHPTAQRGLMQRNRDDTGRIVEWAPYAQAGVRGYLVWRRPDVATTVDEYVYEYPETLTIGGSAPLVDEDWHELIAEAVAGKVANLQGEPSKAKTLNEQFIDNVFTRRTPDEEPMAARSIVVRA